jgi:protein-tyrosine phosphatase
VTTAIIGDSLPASRPWKRALVWLPVLAVVFFATYNLSNAITAQRTAVGSIVFDWERHVPLLPWTIVPYWLIDLLYGLSLLLCRTRRELDTHAWRLLAVQAFAVTCFLLFPLRFSFERPPVEGVFGSMFDALMVFDRPFNQAPSLHIALLVVLCDLYLRVLSRRWHWLVYPVALLIGVSVLTTWQHHFIDIPTGLWLGWFCVWLLPHGQRPRLAGTSWTGIAARRRLALRYAAGAGLFAAVATAGFAAGGGGGWLWLWWVSGSLMMVALIYGFLDEAAFGKCDDGTMTSAARWLLGPYLAGAWINSRIWTHRLARADQVVPGVLLGRMPGPRDLSLLEAGAVIDVCAELPCAADGVHYRSVPMLDLVPPAVAQLEQASRALEEAIMAMGRRGSHGWTRSGGVTPTVLVCCALGLSRSALVVAAWLLRGGHARSPEDAIARLRAVRPAIVLGDAQVDVLSRWYRQHLAGAPAAPVETVVKP